MAGLGVLLLGCAGRQPPPQQAVRLDFARVLQAFPEWQAGFAAIERQAQLLEGTAGRRAPGVQPVPIPASPSQVSLPPVLLPPAPDPLAKRRVDALQALRQQREAVREHLLATFYSQLTFLKQQWKRELEATLLQKFDPETLQARLTEVRESYGRRLFPLLIRKTWLQENQPEYQGVDAQIEQIQREWNETEATLQRQWQEEIAAVQQEIEAELAKRERQALRQAEELIARQIQESVPSVPLLPHGIKPSPAPAVRLTLKMPRSSPAAWVSLQSNLAQKRAEWQQRLRQHWEALASQWARRARYLITRDPKAPDKTEEFIRFLGSGNGFLPLSKSEE